jgi:hypothetical protein
MTTNLEEACTRGHDAGYAAGTWMTDGNTTDQTYRFLLTGLETGDPEVLDMMPSPLSGEWAGESIQELLGDLLEDGGDDDADTATNEEIFAAYEEGFQVGWEHEIVRACRYQLNV